MTYSKDGLEKITEDLISGTKDPRIKYGKSNSDLGTAREWAEMHEDGSISRTVSQWLPDGSYGHGSTKVLPGESGYEELRSAHNLAKRGDSSIIVKKWCNGKWEIV